MIGVKMTAEQSESVNARKNRWHQSTLSNLLDGCSWQYFLTYILELPQGLKPYALVGSAFHSSVELHENNRMSDPTSITTIEDMEAEGLQFLTDNITEPIEDALLVELTTNMKSAIYNWYTNIRPVVLNWKPVAIEPEFTIPLVDQAKPIGGYIDAIYQDDTGRYFIVDWKTAKNFDRWRDADGHRHQAAMYSVALVLSEDFPEITEMPEMVYMVVRTQKSVRSNFEPFKIVKVQPTIEDVKLLGDRIRLAEYTVANEHYTQKTDWPLCSKKWCPFYEGCQVTLTLSGTPDLVRSRMLQQLTMEQLESQSEGHGETQYPISETKLTTTEEV